MEQSVICCIWRSNSGLKPNYSHKTNFYSFILFYFLKKEEENNPTHFFHILGSVAEGNATSFFLAYAVRYERAQKIYLGKVRQNYHCVNWARVNYFHGSRLMFSGIVHMWYILIW